MTKPWLWESEYHGPTCFRCGFTQKERDLESGNDYFGARYYRSAMGRFVSPDPGWFLQANLADSQSWNMYSYVQNNPLVNIDPTGMKDCGQLDWTGDYFEDDVGNCGDAAADGVGAEAAIAAATSSSQSPTAPSYILHINGISTPLDGGPPTGCDMSTLFCQMQFESLFGQIQRVPFITTRVRSAASNPQPSVFSCTFNSKTGKALGTTALDAVGIIPGGNDVVHGVQFGAGVAAAGISISGGPTGAGLSAAGMGLALADKGGASIAVHGVELIPVAGNIISAGATLNDIFGSDGIIASYKSCFARTN